MPILKAAGGSSATRRTRTRWGRLARSLRAGAQVRQVQPWKRHLFDELHLVVGVGLVPVVVAGQLALAPAAQRLQRVGWSTDPAKLVAEVVSEAAEGLAWLQGHRPGQEA